MFAKFRTDHQTDQHGTSHRATDQRGMVTAEFAASLPIVVFLLFISVGAINAVATALRCQDAAYTAARAAARGEPSSSVGKDGPMVTVETDGKLVRATANTDLKVWGARLPALHISARAVAMRELGELPP